MEKIIKAKPEPYIPVDGRMLQDLDYCRDRLVHMIDGNRVEIKSLAWKADKLSDYDAATLGVLREVHNIKNMSVEIENYLAIVDMLLDNLEDDLRKIRLKREAHMRAYFEHIAAMEKAEKKEIKRISSRERMQRKRAADKAAVNAK